MDLLEPCSRQPSTIKSHFNKISNIYLLNEIITLDFGTLPRCSTFLSCLLAAIFILCWADILCVCVVKLTIYYFLKIYILKIDENTQNYYLTNLWINWVMRENSGLFYPMRKTYHVYTHTPFYLRTWNINDIRKRERSRSRVILIFLGGKRARKKSARSIDDKCTASCWKAQVGGVCIE